MHSYQEPGETIGIEGGVVVAGGAIPPTALHAVLVIMAITTRSDRAIAFFTFSFLSFDVKGPNRLWAWRV
jgi:hypothetical protein